MLTGSTRLKAGTATKLILNIFTTLAMVRLGKVAGNLMVDLNPSNVKLRDRAVRIVRELRQVDHATAESAPEKSGWVVKRACVKLVRGAKGLGMRSGNHGNSGSLQRHDYFTACFDGGRSIDLA